MLPAKHNTNPRSRDWITQIALIVLVCQGCAHPWNSKTSNRSGIQPQLPNNSINNPTLNQAESNLTANQVTVEVSTDNKGNAGRLIQPNLPLIQPKTDPQPPNQPISSAWNKIQLAPSAVNPTQRPADRELGPGKAAGRLLGRGFIPLACRPASGRLPQTVAIQAASHTSDDPPKTSFSGKRQVISSSSPDSAPAGWKPVANVPTDVQSLSPQASRPLRTRHDLATYAGNSHVVHHVNRAVNPATTVVAPEIPDRAKPKFIIPASFDETSADGTLVKEKGQGEPTTAQAESELESQPQKEDEPEASTARDIQQRMEKETQSPIGADPRLRSTVEATQEQLAQPLSPLPNPPPNVLPTGPVQIPLDGADPAKDIELTMKNGRVSLVTRNAPVQTVLNMLAEQQGLNLITTEDVIDTISVTLTNVAFEDAINSIVDVAGCTWTQNRGIVLVSKIGGGRTRSAPSLQGKVVQVFPLNFVAARDVEITIKGLLSPLGQVFSSQTMVGDKRRTQELVVVEDIPTSVARISQYLHQIDQPPRQVMIEAHVLQVDLTDNMQHGVDWKFLTTYMGRSVGFNTVGFTNPTASPTSIFSFNGDHLGLIIQALKTTTDAKTLASPNVIVANGQEARIQIGAKLGYFVTTTTQTSTLQNVNFLNTGVVMRVTPQISNDGRVLMVVRPEVSTGSISAAGLPQTNTTEAETTLLMEDNGGMIIGGLIKESDSDTQNKIPLLGDLWLVGRLFQQRVTARVRSEIIIVLLPRIVPYSPDGRAAELAEIQRTTTPLFQNGLQPAPRPLDPRLPDAINNPRRLIPSRLPKLFSNPQRTNPRPLNYYFPTEDEEFFPAENQYINSPVLGEVPVWGDPPAQETLSVAPHWDPVPVQAMPHSLSPPAIEPPRLPSVIPNTAPADSGGFLAPVPVDKTVPPKGN